jgi:hypothetical protein
MQVSVQFIKCLEGVWVMREATVSALTLFNLLGAQKNVVVERP